MGHLGTTSNTVSVRRRRSTKNLITLPESIGHASFYDPRKDEEIEEPIGILAIDSEYQGPVEALSERAIKEGYGKVEMLSMQYCGYVIDDSTLYENDVWSATLYPKDGQRLKLAEILISALAQAKREGACERLPRRWYIVGHFLRADLPLLADFQSVNQAISAVRGTFTSVGKSAKLNVEFFFEEEPIELTLIFRDTINLLPEGRKSLATAAALVGMGKVSLGSDPTIEQEYKRNMKDFLANNPALFEQYAEVDAIATAAYADRVMREVKDMTGERSLPVTLTGTAVTLFENMLEADGRSRLKILGKEEVVTAKWYSRFNGFRTERKEVYLPLVDAFVSLATEAYQGGRNEQYYFGPSHVSLWKDFDLSGAYGTGMSLIKTPDWENIRTSLDPTEYSIETLGVAMVDFEFPHGTRFPTMPVRTANGLIFPLKGSTCCGAPEIALALSLGAALRIRHGVIVPYTDKYPVFGTFIQFCVAQRYKYPKGSLMHLLWKEFANATYGKLAQGLREKRVFDNRDGDTKPLPESRITQPFFAAYVTSYIRATLGEIMNRLPETAAVHSCTTDGFLTDATEDEVLQGTRGPICTLFGQSREALTGKFQILEKKHEVRQLLGWRTRGQATLQQGKTDQGDDYDIVLAKAGIYTASNQETVRQRNAYITNLFFHRSYSQTIQVFMKTGLRDIVLLGADLVEKYRFKRLGMEYDFKCRPHSAVMDEKLGHLCFTTKPWTSVIEFNATRVHLEAFLKATDRCLKKTADFKDFATYLLTKTSLKGKAATHLSSKNGDLKRLRQSVACAWKKSMGGLVFREGVQTAGEFAELLTNCGLPCKRADVENAAKKPFVGKDCPPTPAVRDAMARLQEALPTIDPSAFLADAGTVGAINLLDALDRLDHVTSKVVEQTHKVPLGQ